MTSQHRIQQYMEKHKVARLFEDLMNKVIHDQPDDPLVYLIKVLCKKAGKEVPPEARLSQLRRSTSDLPRAPSSPEMSRKNRPTSSGWASGNQDALTRPYERPWMSNTKKVKSRKSVEQDDHTRPVSAYIKPSLGPTLSPTIRRASLDEFLRIKPISPGRRQKTVWNPDTKVMTSNFDELFDEQRGGKSRTKTGTDNSKRAWASYGLGDGEENLFSSSGYRGPKVTENEADPLSRELISPSYKRVDTREASQASTASSVSSRVKGPRISAQKHRQELEKLVRDSDKRSTDSGIYDDKDGDDEDDAIELLEDADVLRREGVKNIPSKGYKLSRTVRQADPEVKLNINLYTGSGPLPSQQSTERRYGELSDYDDSEREGSLIGSRYTPESDEDFESVSQVTGPRHPIWTAPDSDGEVPAPRPPLSSSNKAVTIATPYRSEDYDRRSPWEGRLATTSPYRSADIYSSQSVNREDPYRPNTQESMDMYGGAGGGWAVREGSDVSQTDWKGTKKGRSSKRVDYRSY